MNRFIPRLILASGSPRRHELLDRWEIPHQVLLPDVDELTHAEDPTALVTMNARRKAENVIASLRGRTSETGVQWVARTDPKRPAGLESLESERAPFIRYAVVGVDTVVVIDDQVLGKPGTTDESTRMLGRLNGRSHEVHSGLYLAWHDRPGEGLQTSQRTRVWFRSLSDEEIDWYVQSGEGTDKAGAYGIQDRGGSLVDRIEGCYFNVVGFPIATFIGALSTLGISLDQLRSGRTSGDE